MVTDIDSIEHAFPAIFSIRLSAGTVRLTGHEFLGVCLVWGSGRSDSEVISSLIQWLASSGECSSARSSDLASLCAQRY